MPYFLLTCVIYQQGIWCTGMESLTKQFEQRIAEFLRRTQLTPSEFGERATGDRKLCGDLQRGRSPRLPTVDRVPAFMEAYEGAVHGALGSNGSRASGILPRRQERRSDDTSGRAGRGRPRPHTAVSTGVSPHGLSRSTVYRRLAEGAFPNPVQLGARAVGWVESEVDEWIRQRIVASRGEAH